MIHIPYAIIIQLLLVLIFGLPLWVGIITAFLVFAMREITQAEYRWIEKNGGLRAAMPWWKGMDVSLWDWHSRTDVIWPVAATAALTIFVMWRGMPAFL